MTLILLTVVIAVDAGPFLTLSLLSFGERLIYWGIAVPMAFFTALFIVAFLAPLLREAHRWKSVVAKTAAMGVLFTPFIYGWTVLMVPSVDGITTDYARFLRDVILISLAVFVTLEIFMARKIAKIRAGDGFADAAPELYALQDTPDTSDVPQIPRANRSRLLRRIVAGDPGPVLRLEALDHFVTVVTSAGQYNLRMRFADAVDEMDGVEGIRAHRSHWVAQHAILGAERQNNRLFVHVACGARIPVSRKYLPQIEALGLG